MGRDPYILPSLRCLYFEDVINSKLSYGVHARPPYGQNGCLIPCKNPLSDFNSPEMRGGNLGIFMPLVQAQAGEAPTSSKRQFTAALSPFFDNATTVLALSCKFFFEQTKTHVNYLNQ